MKVFVYATSKSLDSKLIPRTAPGNLVLFSNTLYSSRTIKDLNYSTDNSPYEGIRNDLLLGVKDYWSDYKYDNIKYILNYDDYTFIKNVEQSSSNIFDKVLNLNPKQVGVVNTSVQKLFCEGNEIHYSILKHAFIPLIYSENIQIKDDDGDSSEIEKVGPLLPSNPLYGRNVKLDTGLMGWGEIKINHILFVSLLDRFYKEGQNEYQTPSDVGVAYNLVRRLAPGDVNNLFTINFKSNISESFYPFFMYNSGSKTGQLYPYVDDPLFSSYAIKLQKDTHFTSEGVLKGALNKSTGLRPIDLKLQKMYFWKSGIIMTTSEENENNYYLLVGLIPVNYRLTAAIDKMFFVDLGNTLLNEKFDENDIVLYYSTLKQFLKKAKPKTVYFINLSINEVGNVCKNGLAFGADSELLKNIVKNINSGSTNYSSVEYEITNIYNIFTNLEG